jgi:hypothetical protein
LDPELEERVTTSSSSHLVSFVSGREEIKLRQHDGCRATKHKQAEDYDRLDKGMRTKRTTSDPSFGGIENVIIKGSDGL